MYWVNIICNSHSFWFSYIYQHSTMKEKIFVKNQTSKLPQLPQLLAYKHPLIISHKIASLEKQFKLVPLVVVCLDLWSLISYSVVTSCYSIKTVYVIYIQTFCIWGKSWLMLPTIHDGYRTVNFLTKCLYFHQRWQENKLLKTGQGVCDTL